MRARSIEAATEAAAATAIVMFPLLPLIAASDCPGALRWSVAARSTPPAWPDIAAVTEAGMDSEERESSLLSRGRDSLRMVIEQSSYRCLSCLVLLLSRDLFVSVSQLS